MGPRLKCSHHRGFQVHPAAATQQTASVHLMSLFKGSQTMASPSLGLKLMWRRHGEGQPPCFWAIGILKGESSFEVGPTARSCGGRRQAPLCILPMFWVFIPFSVYGLPFHSQGQITTEGLGSKHLFILVGAWGSRQDRILLPNR